MMFRLLSITALLLPSASTLINADASPSIEKLEANGFAGGVGSQCEVQREAKSLSTGMEYVERSILNCGETHCLTIHRSLCG